MKAATRAPASGGVWLVFADPLANRIFFDCGIVAGLRHALPHRLSGVFVLHRKHVELWREHLDSIPLLEQEELMPIGVGPVERVVRRVDIELDKRVGFYPSAVRHSLRYGFHQGRWAPGNSFEFLDSSRIGPLPRVSVLEEAMARWLFSKRRYVPSALLERMRAGCEAVVVTNLQARAAIPVLTAARRLGLPVVGYVASWDHPVGKGLVSPYLDRYIVQNETMRIDLERYHRIDPERVTVTGWPQTDLYHRRRRRGTYEELLHGLGLERDKPVVLFAGNAPNNSPYEGNLVTRLVSWWRDTGARERFSLLFRPHPYDRQVPERFGAALGQRGIAVQAGSYSDLENLATLLQHVDCLVANGGTILLEALVNDRPSVCVTFDEGAPPGRSWAPLNLGGEHYRKLAESAAFYRADDFDQLVTAIDRALSTPAELGAERQQVTREVVGEIDGRAAERVVAAISEVVAREANARR